MSYHYGTILRVLNDDPTNDLDQGDIIIEAGKLDDGDSYTVLGDDRPVEVRMETVAVYENDYEMAERVAVEFARDRYLDENEVTA